MSVRRLSRRLFLSSLAGAALALPACSQNGQFTLLGYTTKPNYDTDHHTIRVPIFKNLTFRRGLEFDLTKEVVDQINLKTPYRVVSCSQDSDTELTGVITVAGKSILNRNQLNEVREAETTLAVELVWRDLKTGEVLSKPRRREIDVRTPAAALPRLEGGPEGEEMMFAPPPPAPGELPVVSGVVVARSLAHYIPEVGESITTAYQKNVKRLATQIVSLMEASW